MPLKTKAVMASTKLIALKTSNIVFGFFISFSFEKRFSIAVTSVGKQVINQPTVFGNFRT